MLGSKVAKRGEFVISATGLTFSPPKEIQAAQ
jgi:hypothetical protein